VSTRRYVLRVRIVSLLPSATEIVFGLGLGADIVAVTDECDYPPEAKALPVVSRCVLADKDLAASEIDRVVADAELTGEPLYRIDEALLDELRPDIILTQDLCPVCALPAHQVEDALRGTQCTANVLSLDPHSIDDVLASIEEVGRALGVETRASNVVSALRGRIDAIRARTSALARPRVLALEWGDPPWGAGHWVPEMIEIAGGVPLCGEHGRDSRRLDWSEIAAASPEIVVFMPCSYGLDDAVENARALFEHEAFTQTPAVRAGRVVATDAQSYFSRSGPRIVDGLDILASIVHPEVFGDPPDEAVAPLR
jgi:iron complex transport system substrate-binding protein